MDFAPDWPWYILALVVWLAIGWPLGLAIGVAVSFTLMIWRGKRGLMAPAINGTQVVDAPYGAGSARADAAGGGPTGWVVKGTEDSMLYLTPASPGYDQTRAEIWFENEDSAMQAGFTAWRG